MEEKYAIENIQDVKNTIEEEITGLEMLNRGFASPGSIYNIFNSPGQAFADNGLNGPDYSYFGLSFVVFTDPGGKKLYAKSGSFKDSCSFDYFSKGLLEDSTINEVFKNKSEISGIFGLNGEEFIISVNPVYENPDKKNISGYIITGKEFSQIEIFRAGHNANSISYGLFSGSQDSLADKSIKSGLLIYRQLIYLNKTGTEFVSYILMPDISNKPELIIKIVQDSEIIRMSRNAVFLYITVALIVMINLIALMMIFFEKFIVLKINKLNDNVGLVSVNKRPSLDNGSGRKNFKFLDEIDSLNINLSRLLSKVSHRNHLKDLVIAIFNEYVHLTRKNVNSFIDGALKKSGSFSGSDRVSILISMKDKIDPEISFEWHADGIDSLIKNTRDIPAGGVKWLFDKLKAEGMFYLETMEDLPPEQEQLKKILRGAGTKSLLSIGMFFGNSIIGILSFGTVIEEKKWSSDDIELLRNISGILASVIIRLKHGIATGI